MILPIRTLVIEIDYIMLGLVASYIALRGFFYNPAISAMWAEAPMMWIRVNVVFDPVHFIAGSYWWENSLAIVEPIARKLLDVFDFGLGSLLLKLAVSRALLRLLNANSYPVRVHLAFKRLFVHHCQVREPMTYRTVS